MFKLYDDLCELVCTNEAFYYVDHVLNDVKYRVFTYRLASYSDFLEPGALEARGIMFRLTEHDGYDGLVSLPFEKFFNLGENPMTMDLDLSEAEIEFIHEKRDGSLITTYIHDGMICLKSKTAVASDQALDASRYLNANSSLCDGIAPYINDDYTVIFEYTSPTNRIVLPYQEDELKILAVRSNITGEYVSYDDLYNNDLGEFMTTDCTDLFDISDMDVVVEQIREMKGIEGFVIGLKTGQRFKIKTDEYFSLHRAKDSIQSDRRLFEVALNGATDDLRTMFHDDQFTLDRIERVEKIAVTVYNRIVSSVEQYHTDNSHLVQKDYAINGQKELDRVAFHLAMHLFHGKTPDYKRMIMNNVDEFLGEG
jgi:T4 RnlA family RNA ligase